MKPGIFNKEVYEDPNNKGHFFYMNSANQIIQLEGLPKIFARSVTSGGKIMFKNSPEIPDEEIIELMKWKKDNKINNFDMKNLAKIFPTHLLKTP